MQVWRRLVVIFRAEGQLWALMILGSLAVARGAVQLILGQDAYHPGYLVLVNSKFPVGVVAATFFTAGMGQLLAAWTDHWNLGRLSSILTFAAWLFTAIMYAAVPHSPQGLWALAVTHAVLAVASGLLFLRLGRL